MKLLIMGPPGAGKGTQAKILAKKFNLFHLSTGDILRKEIEKSSEVGLKAQAYMNAGNLVPDEVLLEMMQSTLTELKDSGVILDGFPRTIPQAIGLSKIFQSLNQEIDKNIQTNKELREYKKLDALYTVSEGLTDVETEKMQKLAEGIEYETEEQYAEKLQTIKENYFPGKEQQQTLTEDASVQTQDDMEVINEENEEEVALAETPESIRRYADAISRTLKK